MFVEPDRKEYDQHNMAYANSVLYRKVLHSKVVDARKMKGIVLIENLGFKFKKEMFQI